MHTLVRHGQNLRDCLWSKVRSDHPEVKRPIIELDFDLIETESKSGVLASHLVARDRRTGSYIYVAELRTDTKAWVAEGSEFTDRIYLFVRHILRCLKTEARSEATSENGTKLREIAWREYVKLTLPS